MQNIPSINNNMILVYDDYLNHIDNLIQNRIIYIPKFRIISNNDNYIYNKNVILYNHNENILEYHMNFSGIYFYMGKAIVMIENNIIDNIIVNNSHFKKEINKTCGICTIDFTDEEIQNRNNINILKCSHVFHTECIVEWYKVKQNCPYCRN